MKINILLTLTQIYCRRLLTYELCLFRARNAMARALGLALLSLAALLWFLPFVLKDPHLVIFVMYQNAHLETWMWKMICICLATEGTTPILLQSKAISPSWAVSVFPVSSCFQCFEIISESEVHMRVVPFATSWAPPSDFQRRCRATVSWAVGAFRIKLEKMCWSRSKPRRFPSFTFQRRNDAAVNSGHHLVTSRSICLSILYVCSYKLWSFPKMFMQILLLDHTFVYIYIYMYANIYIYTDHMLIYFTCFPNSRFHPVPDPSTAPGMATSMGPGVKPQRGVLASSPGKQPEKLKEMNKNIIRKNGSWRVWRCFFLFWVFLMLCILEFWWCGIDTKSHSAGRFDLPVPRAFMHVKSAGLGSTSLWDLSRSTSCRNQGQQRKEQKNRWFSSYED